VAYCLSQGLAETRKIATERRAAFEEWLRDHVEEPGGEDLIDPRHFQRWQRSLPKKGPLSVPKASYPAVLTGTDGLRKRYAVVPVHLEGKTRWLDPAGYELAVSNGASSPDVRRFRSDYELLIEGRLIKVDRTFRP